MNKYIQAIFLILALSIGIASRLTVAGWLFFIGAGTILIFGISHLLIHNYAKEYLSIKKFSNIVLVTLSHLFFILIFLFQIDADDSRSYSIIGFVINSENQTLVEYGLTMVLISILGYVIIFFVILLKARKAKLLKFDLNSIALTALSSIAFIHLISILISTKKDIDYYKQFEKTGEYHSIRRALKESDRVIALKINPYESSLTEIPKEILEFPNLMELDLTDQNISAIPQILSEAKSLEILNLIGNDIQAIPSSVCDCKKLRELRLAVR